MTQATGTKLENAEEGKTHLLKVTLGGGDGNFEECQEIAWLSCREIRKNTWNSI
jgi:hypothetical protein